MLLRKFAILSIAAMSFMSASLAQPAPSPRPDAQFGNWLYKTPDPKFWKVAEKNGSRVYYTDSPPGDYCTITLFPDAKSEADLKEQFDQAVAADQKAKDTIKVEADTGPISKPAPGIEVLTRNMRSETSALHTLHMYVAMRKGDHFNLAAFQTTSEGTWKYFGQQAAQFIASLQPANIMPPDEVDKMFKESAQAEPPPSLPGVNEEAQIPAVETTKVEPKTTLVAAKVPDRPLSKSSIVVNNAVIQKNGKPVNGIKVSQHDMQIASPSIAVGVDGTIHIAFIEQHRTTYALATYYRESKDGGKTWSEAKNLSEDMPKINVGKCWVLVDAKNRTYVIWRAGLAVDFPVSLNASNNQSVNLVYRVLDNGKWSKIIPVHPFGTYEKQNDGANSSFAVVDPEGIVQIVWNAMPDKWHPELTHGNQHLSGVGNGLVFQTTLNGTQVSQSREIFLTPSSGQTDMGGYGTYCDGLDSINGYFDSNGQVHFLAAISRSHDDTLRGKSVFNLIENGKMNPALELPDLSFHGWNDVPTLLIDATGKRHAIVLYPEGEHPSIRDYNLDAEEEPVIIRQTADIKGKVDSFQAYQGPNGKMVAVMQMNDTGDRATGETYISTSYGKAWTKPVNVTNNEGRRRFVSTQTGSESNVAIEESYYPGPAAVAFDKDGNLLLLMINNEYGLFGSSAFGVQLSLGSSSTPTLQFLRF